MLDAAVRSVLVLTPPAQKSTDVEVGPFLCGSFGPFGFPDGVVVTVVVVGVVVVVGGGGVAVVVGVVDVVVGVVVVVRDVVVAVVVVVPVLAVVVVVGVVVVVVVVVAGATPNAVLNAVAAFGISFELRRWVPSGASNSK
jgi:hypothetical protein